LSQKHPAFRALIIDDDVDLLFLVRRTLEFTAGWEVHTAASGVAGIELTRSIGPDVVLVDVMMPELDGYEVCRRLKEDDATARIPVVLLTARREMDLARTEAAGVAGVLYKPFQPAELAAQIQALCR
jgi:two-component system, OmpR family, alkaline phosphatase synthesis response regulator PhoP